MILRFSKKRSHSDRESLWSLFSRHCQHWYSLLYSPSTPKSSSDLFSSSSELDKASTALLLHQRWKSGLPALSKEPEKVELGGLRAVQPARGQEHLQAHRLAHAGLGRARPHQVNTLTGVIFLKLDTHEKLSLINLSWKPSQKVRLGEESLPDGSLQVGQTAHSQAAGMS